MMDMSRRERVLSVLKGLPVDRQPVGFWMHFPESSFFGQASVNAHLDFFEESRTDMCKVMTEWLYPCDHNINDAKDWNLLPSYGEDADFIQKQAGIVRAIVSKVKDASILGTVHGVVASASHTLLGIQRYDSIGRHALVYHLRTDPEAVGKAFRRVADTLCGMVRAQVKAGADGIYYAALGGETDVFSDEEHAEFIAPCDKKVIEAAYDAGAKYVVLHMCKPKVNLRRFVSYHCDVVNWGIEESGMSLNDGLDLFPGKTILGGFNNRHGSIISGDHNAIRKDVASIINGFKGDKLILGSDCTLPGTLSYGNIAAVVDALEEYSSCMRA